MNNMFLKFLNKIKYYNPSLIEAITKGFLLIESINNDMANELLNVPPYPNLAVGSAIYYNNSPTEYFNQTLSAKNIKKVKQAQMGFRMSAYPIPGRTYVEKDPFKFTETSNYSANYGSQK